jgi:hypothetical protein
MIGISPFPWHRPKEVPMSEREPTFKMELTTEQKELIRETTGIYSASLQRILQELAALPPRPESRTDVR